jgi:hypothetical protein
LGEEKGRSFQVASKRVALFKSPHTGNLGESNAGRRKEILENLKGHKNPLKVVISVHINSNLKKT